MVAAVGATGRPRWAGSDPDRARFYAGELVGMKPDVIFINHALGIAAVAAGNSHDSDRVRAGH
jgi:hypothetical protein